MLSIPLTPRDFSPRTTRRPRTWQMFSFMRLRMRPHREIPTNFTVPLHSSRIDIQFVPSIRRNIEEIALPFVLHERNFSIKARRKIFADLVFNSVLR